MTMAERIKERRKAMNLTQEELAERLGLQKSAIAKYENGRVQNIKRPVIAMMAKILDCSPAYLMGFDDEINDSPAPPHPDLRPVTTKQYKVLGSVACGEPIFMAEQMDVTVDAENIPAADYVLTAKGDSMINIGIHDGDLVFVHSQPMVENGQVAVVAIGDEATLKRFYYYQEKDLMILKPENPSCRDIIKTGKELEDVRVLGRAVKFLTDVR